MANTTFVNQSTVIDASWLNDVNDVSYDVLGDGTSVPSSKAVVRTNLNVPQRNGTDATGTWPIAISGNAATASALTGTLAVANGGTGATTAANARTNLGLVIGTDVLAPAGSGAALTEVGPRLGTSVTASGTAVDFTGIPSWVKRITLLLSSVSTNGTSDLLVRLGDSGGIETTGYLGSATTVPNSTPATSSFTNGLGLHHSGGGSASGVFHFAVTFSLLSGNLWVGVSTGARSDTAAVYSSTTSKALSDVLDRVRVTTANGTDAFDGGSINISWE